MVCIIVIPFLSYFCSDSEIFDDDDAVPTEKPLLDLGKKNTSPPPPLPPPALSLSPSLLNKEPSSLLLNTSTKIVHRPKSLLPGGKRPVEGGGGGGGKGSFSRQLAANPEETVANLKARRPAMKLSLQQPRELTHHTGDLISRLSASYSEDATTISPDLHPSYHPGLPHPTLPPPSPSHQLLLPPAVLPLSSPTSPRRLHLPSCHLNRQRAAAETMKLHTHSPSVLNQTWLQVSPCLPSSSSPSPRAHPSHLSIHLPMNYHQVTSSGQPYSEDLPTLKSESRLSGTHSSLSHHSSDHLIAGADIATGTGELLLLDKEGRVVHQVSGSNRNVSRSLIETRTAREIAQGNKEEEDNKKGRGIATEGSLHKETPLQDEGQ